MTAWVRDAGLKCVGYRRLNTLSAVKTLAQATGGSTIAGVLVNFVQTGTAAGTGTLTYTTADTKIKWTAPGDAIGAGVDISGGGVQVITSANGKTISLTVTAGSLPGVDTTDAAVLVGIPGYGAAGDLAGPGGVPAKFVLVQPETQGVRFRGDGITTTTTLGTPIATTQVELLSGDFSRYSFIELTASAVLHLQYYR